MKSVERSVVGYFYFNRNRNHSSNRHRRNFIIVDLYGSDRGQLLSVFMVIFKASVNEFSL